MEVNTDKSGRQILKIATGVTFVYCPSKSVFLVGKIRKERSTMFFLWRI